MEAGGFALISVALLVSAIAVVRGRNLVHAVLWLGMTLLSTAALYAMLDASFVAGVQVLLYVGGVVTLMIFGVMITLHGDGKPPEIYVARDGAAAATALALFSAIAWAIEATPGLDASSAPAAVSIADVGRVILRDQLLAFETISMLLLAAIIGAIVVARRKDPGTRTSPSAALEAAARAAE